MPDVERRPFGNGLLPARRLHHFQFLERRGVALRPGEILLRLAVLGDERPRLVDGRQGLRRKILLEEGADVLGPDVAVGDQLRQRVHGAVEIDQHVGPLVAAART